MTYDRVRAAREHNQLIDRLDSEIEADSDPYEIAEQERWKAANARWGYLPTARTPRGTLTERMDERQTFHADQEDRHS